MNKLRVSAGLNFHVYPRTETSEYIHRGLAYNKRIGFDAVDFSMKYVDLMGDQWEEVIEKVLADMDEIGIRCELCHLPYGVKIDGTPEEIEKFNARVHRAIEAAKRLGVSYAVVHPNTTTIPRLKFDKTAQYDSVMAHLSPFIEHGNREGVNIVIENMRPVPQIYPFHRYCAEPEELCTIADALGIGVCWDFGHAHINGLKQSDGLKYVGSRLRVLHVNDNFTWGDDHLAPFMGTIDWADAMQGLSAIGYQGLLNFELSTERIPECARESFAKYVIDVAGRLNQLL